MAVDRISVYNCPSLTNFPTDQATVYSARFSCYFMVALCFITPIRIYHVFSAGIMSHLKISLLRPGVAGTSVHLMRVDTAWTTTYLDTADSQPARFLHAPRIACIHHPLPSGRVVWVNSATLGASIPPLTTALTYHHNLTALPPRTPAL